MGSGELLNANRILLEFTDCCNYYLISIIDFIHYNEYSLTDKQTFCYICQQQSVLQRNAKSLTALWWTCWNTLRQPPVRNWNWLVKNDVQLASVHPLRLSSSHDVQETKSPFGSMIFTGIICTSCTSDFCLCCLPSSFSSFHSALLRMKGVPGYTGEHAELLLLLECAQNNSAIPTCSYKIKQ